MALIFNYSDKFFHILVEIMNVHDKEVRTNQKNLKLRRIVEKTCREETKP